MKIQSLCCLRLVSSQFPFEPGLFSEFSRPALLFHEIPQQLQKTGRALSAPWRS